MRKLALENSLFEYLLKLLNDEKEEYIDVVDDSPIDLNNIIKIILSKSEKSNESTSFEIDDIEKTKLIQYLEDKQIEIGFENEDYLNEDGKKLQQIYDEIYNLKNNIAKKIDIEEILMKNKGNPKEYLSYVAKLTDIQPNK